MCVKTVFHPTGPCCGGDSLCSRWPEIDWLRTGWKVSMPAARLAEERYADEAYALSPAIHLDDGSWSYVGSVPDYGPEGPQPGSTVVGDVYVSTFGYHIRQGQFLAGYSGGCQWSVLCRERLCPGVVAIALLDNSTTGQIWYATADHVLEVGFPPGPDFGDWEAWTLFNDGVYSAEYTSGNNPGFFVSWRRVLKAAECGWIAAREAAGWDLLGSDNSNGIEGGLAWRLEQARLFLRQGGSAVDADMLSSIGSWYQPTAMDVAVSWTLDGAIDFGVVTDSRSPLFGQFLPFAGGEYQTEGDSSYLVSSPWELTSESEIVAEFGVVHRFTRTGGSDTLPEWIDLELVRI